MKMRKVPMRTCVITHERFEKKELIRVVRTPEGEVIVDESGKKNGKGGEGEEGKRGRMKGT